MREEEIRPELLISKYRELSEQDSVLMFSPSERFEISCVGCDSESAPVDFEKKGFKYCRCVGCGSVFLSPRPPAEHFAQFYAESKSTEFWAKSFFPAVAEVRREKIFKPRVEKLTDYCRKKGIETHCVVDVGAGFGIFLEEWQKLHPESNVVAVEPSIDLADVCRSKGFSVESKPLEEITNLEEVADLVVCFEVLEHVHDPLGFVSALRRLARPGGLVVVSTLTIDGFDLQMLGALSDQITPPHHINFLSKKGLISLFERAGMRSTDLETPGRLDVDIVKSALRNDTAKSLVPKFIQEILKSEEASGNFQSFLSKNQLSSHVWVFGVV